jgi:hypothetical protein
VQQSLSVKKVLSKRLILFFYSVESENPFASLSADSRYSFDEIVVPFSSLNYNEKSLTTHINEGKIL